MFEVILEHKKVARGLFRASSLAQAISLANALTHPKGGVLIVTAPDGSEVWRKTIS